MLLKIISNPLKIGNYLVTLLLFVVAVGIVIDPLQTVGTITALAKPVTDKLTPEPKLDATPKANSDTKSKNNQKQASNQKSSKNDKSNPKATPAKSASYSDSFKDANTLTNNWTIVDAPDVRGWPTSSWYIKDGELVQNSNIYRGGDNLLDMLEGTNIITKAVEPQNFTIDVDFHTLSDNDGVGVIFHYKDPKNYYRFVTVQDATSNGPFSKLQVKVKDNFVTLASNDKGYDPAEPHHVQIKVYWGKISVTFDGHKYFTVNDGHNNTGGHAGLQTYANHVAFDNFKMADQGK